ncbi:hypothetical protein UB37_11105 [Photobacterium iliopiscarium]|jgi:hypothetical protein|uniref:DUF4250 domain-containing protein n=1 Tax=Photobacterium iliopiscarium TaxID=56192 RepID=A0A0D8PW18_9GAMM|nr:DUF4250 domain-containing protein [Photobacterium iliopiscarium]KJG12954.1 hypothetical protein UB38_12120 [Photobacterium iliopiscarium]KJG21409.1 hypothetical protein UB37_11105 [Photobacterium iliopiscarium]MCD9467641.1 DUF4250 domain-containing protein [Photobacterium iliopiscarium]MCD9487347.1 DUF4250 domain-containing protein [Photobacterium iliopiscarium]MCF2244013.1 DUF4250 domain-containing protein [Photobacterium iliopiscarium]
MDLSKFETMDTIMLMSIINMKIRDEFNTLDNLVKFFDIDREQLIAKLATGGFDFLPEVQQFR